MITASQAVNVSGLSKSTLKRWAKSRLESDPESKSFILKEKTPSGYRYLFDEAYLLSNLPTNIIKKKEENTPKADYKLTTEIVIDALKQQLEEKNKLLEQKDKLIEQQDFLIRSILPNAKQT